MATANPDMAAIDYSALTKARQKIAAFLIVIGPDAAAELMKHFENAEVEAICRELATLDVPRRRHSAGCAAGICRRHFRRSQFTSRWVVFCPGDSGKGRGGYAAVNLLDRIAPQSRGTEGGNEIRQLEVRQIMEPDQK